METSQEIDIKRYALLIYHQRYLFVAVMVLVTSLIIAIGFILPKKYEAKSIVFIQTDFLNAVMRGIAVSTPSIEERTQALSMILKSRPLILKVLKDLNLGPMPRTEGQLEALVPTFAKKTVIEISSSNRRGMDMFTVAVTHSNPVLARDYVNTLVQKYIEENTVSTRESSYGANRFIAEQSNLLRDKLNVIETTIAQLSQQKDSMAQERLEELQKRLNVLLGQYTENHPEVVKIKDEINNVKSELRRHDKKREVIGDRPTTAQQASIVPPETSQQQTGQTSEGIAATDLYGKAQRREGEAGSSVKRRLADLERDRETYGYLYGELVKAQGKSEVSTRMEGEDKGGIFHIFESADLPQKPVSPKRVLIILFGIAAGIGAGMGLIILKDYVFKSVKDAKSLSTFGLPVLAVVPRLRTREEIQKTRKKDAVLYLFTGLYYTGVFAVLVRELIAGGML